MAYYPFTPVITGTTITRSSALAITNTWTLTPSTAQGSLDFSTLMIRAENVSTTADVTFTIRPGTEYSGIGAGTSATITIPKSTASAVLSDNHIIVGGHFFEGSRYLSSADTIVIYIVSGTGPCYFEAYQAPRANE